MATQVQIRGTTQATQEGRTLAARELDVNTTDVRLSVHNGSDAGGVPHVNWKDAINQEFTYAAATGTDAVAITLAKAPAAYAAGQKFVFKAANANTGSATLNVNSLGAKTLKKKNVQGGTIAALAAGDIIAGGIYTAFYDGTDMVLESVDAGGGDEWTYGSATPSGSSFTVVSGLSGVSEIELFFDALGMSTNPNNKSVLRIGDSGGIETSGYVQGANVVDAGTLSVNSDTNGFLIIADHDTSETFSGVVRLMLADDVSIWGANCQFNESSGKTVFGGGIKALTTELTQVQVARTAGTSTYNAGTVYYRYR